MRNAPSPRRQPEMSFWGAISQCLREYASFSGRATRREFWWWVLAIIAGYFAVSAVSIVASLLIGFSLLTEIFLLVVALPTMAVTSRRLHDINRSGWWQLAWYTLVALAAALSIGIGSWIGLLRAKEKYWGVMEFEDAIRTPEFLISLTMGIVIAIVLCAPLVIGGIIFMAREGQSGPNHFGFDPRFTGGP